jgi:hypothetical protein
MKKQSQSFYVAQSLPHSTSSGQALNEVEGTGLILTIRNEILRLGLRMTARQNLDSE